MGPLRIATACATILLSLAAGCGGNSGTAQVEPTRPPAGTEPSQRPADVWTRDFCTAFLAWSGDVAGRVNHLLQEELPAKAEELRTGQLTEVRKCSSRALTI
jgi:hypothetical protein